MKSFLRDTLATLVMAGVIFFGLQFTVDSIIVDGPSMNPNFHTGQRLVVNKVFYKIHEPERGDVIILHSPNGGQGDLIKRIIGLPGESVEIKDGVVYIYKEDGTVLPLDEPYITEQAENAYKRGKIPENEYFVLGDNRNISDDSRHGWTLSFQNIVGKVWLSIWPSDKWGLVANYQFESE
ncbi:signal peptidase I [Chloroflexota bacterium]